MKKIFFSLVALAALAACSKSEIAYEQTGEIGFVPVAKKATKVAEDDAVYNTKLDMYIFANTYTDADENSFTQPYFANARFKHREDGIFGGADAVYYWPNVKTLKFAGLSASGNVNNDATPKLTADLEIQLDGYAPGTGGDEEGDNDLMWFPTTQAYGKSHVPGTGDTPATDDNIEVVMQHACAWVTINIKGDDVTGADTNPWTITNVSFNDLSQSGDVLLGTNAQWSDLATGATCTVFTGEEELATSVKNFTQIGKFKDLIVVPQATKKLYVTYKYDSDPQSATIPTFSETKEIELTYDSGTTWDAGVHYIYNITIGTKEILVEPTVTTWNPEIVTEITY